MKGDWRGRELTKFYLHDILVIYIHFPLELTLELRIFFLIGNKKTDPQEADFCMVIKVLGS